MPASKKPRKAYRPRSANPMTSPVGTAVVRTRINGETSTLQIRMHLLTQGEECRDLLARLGWVLGIAAETENKLNGPHTPLFRRLHSALRAVLAMRGHWDERQRSALDAILDEAVDLGIRRSDIACRYMDGASSLASAIAAGAESLDDVAGAEIYKEKSR